MSDIFNPGSGDPAELLGLGDQPHIPENVLEELVGEGKKFKTPEDLARGKWESDNFIRKLEKELQETREDLNKRMSAAEVAEQISQLVQQRTTSNPPNTNTADERADDVTSMTPEEIKALLEDKFSQHQQKLSQDENLNTVRNELEAVWGPNYVARLKDKVKNLGLGEDFANGFAATKPKAFLKLVMDEKGANSVDVNPPHSSVRSSPFVSGKKYKDYQRMRTENPALYHSPKVQVEMYEEAKKQGDTFYN